jgi:hypothetical protein
VQTVFTAAERYYDRAPFINPDPACKDPLHPRGTWQAVKNEDRVALEAVAMYVETRAGAFWRVVDDLTGWINKLDVNTLRAAKLALPKAVESIGAYQKAMADLIHGYDETPMFAGVLGGKQYEVDKPISAALKKFCDEDLLESKIPDKFHHSPRLEGLYAKIIDKVISIQARAPLSNPK